MTVRGIMILETLDIFPLPCSSVSGELLPPSSLSDADASLHKTVFFDQAVLQKTPPNRNPLHGSCLIQVFKLTTPKRPLGEDYISKE
jgi:hypothetical protein